MFLKLNKQNIANKIQKELILMGFLGEILTDISSLYMYATDASAYKERPTLVVFPKNNQDVQITIFIANKYNIGIIPRAGGTSLAGQVVGSGIVVDISKHLNSIIEFNEREEWISVQPGMILDELNLYLKKFKLFFGPETSTSNRCTIGGMVGNNACGAHSIIYGSTRDHLIEVKGFLSDGTEVTFKSLSKDDFILKQNGGTLESTIYRKANEILSDYQNRESIKRDYPDPSLKRRNTGYALDMLLNCNMFSDKTDNFNFCKLIAGSEGTLMFITEIKLNLVPLPLPIKGLVCVHFHTVEEALRANIVVLNFLPDAIELIDDIILECTKENISQSKNRFFIKDNPGAILIIEFSRNSMDEIELIKEKLESELRQYDLGYHFPLVVGTDISKVWALRKAALGLLSNVPGDAKPVSLVEDTAVSPLLLPDYINDFKIILKKYNLSSVFHGHAATGELHLRPVLNLKDANDIVRFRKVAEETALLVKRYRGSLSGEHGDGRLRGEFVPLIIGKNNFELCKKIKTTFDPNNIFNPGKIVFTPPMDSQLRNIPGTTTKNLKTFFDFSESQGIIRHIERCNGSADCRKTIAVGGTMCPSYMATLDENKTTRARANVLREIINNSKKNNPFDHKEIINILDLCLSCKACKSECPSNVDMAKLKAESYQQYYTNHWIPLRNRAIAYMPFIYKTFTLYPRVFNFIVTNKFSSSLIKYTLGFAQQRNLPILGKTSLVKWCKKNLHSLNPSDDKSIKKIYFFPDEFTNYIDIAIGIKAIELLTQLGYFIKLLPIEQSGRTYLSKGFVAKAKKIANKNIHKIYEVWDGSNIIGIEPSALLTLRDEYIDLASESNKEKAIKIRANSYLLEEFLATELDAGNISANKFIDEVQYLKIHAHCYQKALGNTNDLLKVLSIPQGYHVEEMKTGCCGMAGAFGMEKEHYSLSNKIGELSLFPTIRNIDDKFLIVASGTSCRQQIKEGVNRKVYHPVEILHKALVDLQM